MVLRKNNSKPFSDNGGHVTSDSLKEMIQPLPNENFILRNDRCSVLATIAPKLNAFARIDRVAAAGVCPATPSNRSLFALS